MNRIKLSNVLTIGISICFLIIISINTLNFPAASDDYTLFLRQLHRDLLNSTGIQNYISYFFAPAFGIHPKLSSRILGLSSYIVFGGINFKFLIILGNICYLFIINKIINIAIPLEKNPFLKPIIFSMMFVPLTLNYRPIFITGFPFHMLFAFFTFYFLSKKKIWICFLFLFLTAFNAGSGIFTGLICGFALAFFSIREKKYIPFSILFLISTFSYLKFIMSYKSAASDASIDIDFNSILSYISYVLVFAQKAITPYFLNYKSFPIIYILIGIGIMGVLVYLLFKKTAETLKSPFFYLCSYVLLNGALAAIVRSGGKNIFPAVAERYEHYSVFFIISFIALILPYITSERIKKGAFVFFMIVFAFRLYDNLYVNKTGYYYHTFIAQNGRSLRKLMSYKPCQYLHTFSYNNICQNYIPDDQLSPERKKIPSARVKVLKHLDEQDFGLLAFTFNNKDIIKEAENIVLRVSNQYFVKEVSPIKFSKNRFYGIFDKTVLRKGIYKIQVFYTYRDEHYTFNLKKGERTFTIKKNPKNNIN